MTSYSELRRSAIGFVTEWAAKGEVLILASVREAADEIALEACRRSHVGAHRMSFREFVREAASYELHRRGLIPVSRVLREALAARVTAEAVRGNRLQYLQPVAEFPGFPRALSETFEELRVNRTPIERLREGGRSGPDLALLLDSYTGALSERSLADHASRVELAICAVESGKHRFDGMPVVFMDVDPAGASERHLLELLKSRAAAVLALGIASEGAPPATSLESLQRNLFSPEGVAPRPSDGSLEIFSASGEALECVEIARRIGFAAEEGVPFDQTAVLLRSPERYQPLVLEALRRAGIPAHCTQGARVPDVAGRSFLALLRCAEEGFSASRFAEYMSLGQMPEEEEPPTPAAWERLLVDAAVIGGPERWKTRLAGLAREFRWQYAAAEEEETREHIRKRMGSLDALAAFALPVIEMLAALPGRAYWGEWLEALGTLAESTLHRAESVRGFLEELEPMADIGPVGLIELLQVLSPRLGAVREPPRQSRYGKVFVGAIEEARGLSFERVFLPGVNEGLFPRPPAEDPLLLAGQRKALQIQLRADDRELLRIAAATASGRLVLSFSRLDLLTGRERVPSFYAFEAHRAAGGPDIDVREFSLRAMAATNTRIGWPAPADPAHAIDDAEFDLATLASLEPGAGEYLKRLPGRSVDSLRTRWRRWHKNWKPADGLVIEEIGNDSLEAYRPAVRAWSPSALQQYARCPYRFALRAIHGLRPAERPASIQRIDPATRGEIYHQIQFELFRELDTEGLLPVTSGTLAKAMERLDDIVRKVAAEAEAELAPAIPQIWSAEVQSIRGDLRGWLHHKAQIEPDWKPEFYELSFGIKDPAGRDPRSRREPVELKGGFKLAGSIDAVERRGTGLVRVVDHKTGKIPRPQPEMVGGGEALQPALYALAAEQILGEPVIGGRLFYSTLAQNYQAIDVPLNDFTRSRAMQVFRTIDEALRNGFLPAAPRKDGCKKCEYLPVCGPYEEDRVREKSQPELKPLKDLRAMR